VLFTTGALGYDASSIRWRRVLFIRDILKFKGSKIFSIAPGGPVSEALEVSVGSAHS
jgi:hypothetical protein